jgi:hypothetical protein
VLQVQELDTQVSFVAVQSPESTHAIPTVCAFVMEVVRSHSTNIRPREIHFILLVMSPVLTSRHCVFNKVIGHFSNLVVYSLGAQFDFEKRTNE